MRILLTGASGCVGHYIAETLIKQTNHQLFLLVRNPSKLQIDDKYREGIEVITKDLQQIEELASLLASIDVAILTATAWGDPQTTYEINVTKTLRLLELLDINRLQQVIYFSTASILDKHNQPLPEAGAIGTDYIRTKYECYTRLKELPIASKITTVYPTLVFGGDKHKPYSHLSVGLPEIPVWIKYARWFQADGSFHFVHAQDIATVVTYLVEHPDYLGKQLILGNPAITVNEALKQICEYLKVRRYLSFPLSLWLANVLIPVFRIQMAEWDRFCLQYPHFTYENPVTPSHWGLPDYCPTIGDLLGGK